MKSPEEARFDERGISGRREVIDDLNTIIEGFPNVRAAADALGLGLSTVHAIKTGNAVISSQTLHALYGPRGNQLVMPKGFDSEAVPEVVEPPLPPVSPAVSPPSPPAEPEAAIVSPPVTISTPLDRACAESAAVPDPATVFTDPTPRAASIDTAALAAKLTPILTDPIAAAIDTLRDHRELAAARLAEAQTAFQAACAARNDADEAVTKIDCAIEVLEGLAA